MARKHGGLRGAVGSLTSCQAIKNARLHTGSAHKFFLWKGGVGERWPVSGPRGLSEKLLKSVSFAATMCACMHAARVHAHMHVRSCMHASTRAPICMRKLALPHTCVNLRSNKHV
eukprot:364858-Chlamydomonas_euryale.AAC.1